MQSRNPYLPLPRVPVSVCVCVGGKEHMCIHTQLQTQACLPHTCTSCGCCTCGCHIADNECGHMLPVSLKTREEEPEPAAAPRLSRSEIQNLFFFGLFQDERIFLLFFFFQKQHFYVKSFSFLYLFKVSKRLRRLNSNAKRLSQFFLLNKEQTYYV